MANRAFATDESEGPEERPARRSFRPRRKTVIVGAIVASVLIAVFVVPYLVNNGPLRNFAERQMNRHLRGYHVQIGSARALPFGLALDLRNLVLYQDANPDPPVADIQRFHASVHWRELFRGHLVGDLRIEHPRLYVDLKNFRSEQKSNVPIQKKGWQDAVMAVYPLKINDLRIANGEFTYVDTGPFKPLRLSGIGLHASNIRNVEAYNAPYPSPVQVEARVFDTGRLTFLGNANFLEKPHFGVHGSIDLKDMELAYFEPIVRRRNISIHRGALSLQGDLEYAPQMTAMDLKTVQLAGVEAEYVHAAQTSGVEQARVRQAAEKAKNLSNKPTVRIRVDDLGIRNGRFAYMNRAADPGYRIFVDDIRMALRNFSNQEAQGPSTFDITGRFMGSGPTRIYGSIVPATKSPNLALRVAIDDTDMSRLSDLFRTYGNFDIQSGQFSLYSEVKVAGDRINGYVKPLFKNMKVTDRRSNQEKNLFHKLYIAVVKGVTGLLTNRPRHQVATEVDISGPLSSPKTNLLEVIVKLIQNAFIKAILPGFDKEVESPGR